MSNRASVILLAMTCIATFYFCLPTQALENTPVPSVIAATPIRGMPSTMGQSPYTPIMGSGLRSKPGSTLTSNRVAEAQTCLKLNEWCTFTGETSDPRLCCPGLICRWDRYDQRIFYCQPQQ